MLSVSLVQEFPESYETNVPPDCPPSHPTATAWQSLATAMALLYPPCPLAFGGVVTSNQVRPPSCERQIPAIWLLFTSAPTAYIDVRSCRQDATDVLPTKRKRRPGPGATLAAFRTRFSPDHAPQKMIWPGAA